MDLSQIPAIIKDCYEAVKGVNSGEVADYIPQLANVNPDLFGVGFCDVYGNKVVYGDTSELFCLQSSSKPLSYCLARTLEEEVGAPQVHDHVGFEPSGRAFNEFCLNRDGLPHNPLINAGAMMVASMIHPTMEPAHRFEIVQNFYRRLAGNSPGIGFDNSVFLSEKHHADRNISLAYYMRENGAYVDEPTSSELSEHLDLYFQSCAITCNCEAGAVITASLSNHGTCPVTSERVCEAEVTKDCLSIMYMCGMYDFSGQFAFEIGLPAKSGVAGSLFLCIPNVGGICIWSPRLDIMGNSSRGVAFCKEFTKRTNSSYHIFNAMMTSSNLMKGQNRTQRMTLDVLNQRLIYCASMNLVDDIKKLLKSNSTAFINKSINETGMACITRLLNMGDYDKRTPLHLAAAEGHVEMVMFLLDYKIDHAPKDRWGNTPFFEATKCLNEVDDEDKRSRYLEVVSILSALPTTLKPPTPGVPSQLSFPSMQTDSLNSSTRSSLKDASAHSFKDDSGHSFETPDRKSVV